MHPAIRVCQLSFCVVNVIVGVVRVCVARARSHGRWGLSAVTAVRVPRPAPSRSASGEVRHRGPPSARCARRLSTFRIRLFALADSYRSVLYARALPNVTDLPFGRGVGHAMRRVARCYVFYARYVLVFDARLTRGRVAVGRKSGTRRILSSKTVTFAG
jgi:hypothetical protein